MGVEGRTTLANQAGRRNCNGFLLKRDETITGLADGAKVMKFGEYDKGEKLGRSAGEEKREEISAGDKDLAGVEFRANAPLRAKGSSGMAFVGSLLLRKAALIG